VKISIKARLSLPGTKEKRGGENGKGVLKKKRKKVIKGRKKARLEGIKL